MKESSWQFTNNGLVIFCQGIHPRYMVDSSTKICFKFSKIGAVLPDLFCGWQSWPGVPNRDPTVWLNGESRPPKYAIAQHLLWIGQIFLRIRPVYMVDSSTFYVRVSNVSEFIISGIHLSWKSHTKPTKLLLIFNPYVQLKADKLKGWSGQSYKRTFV